jgi:adenylate kinase family enzyme
MKTSGVLQVVKNTARRSSLSLEPKVPNTLIRRKSIASEVKAANPDNTQGLSRRRNSSPHVLSSHKNNVLIGSRGSRPVARDVNLHTCSQPKRGYSHCSIYPSLVENPVFRPIPEVEIRIDDAPTFEFGNSSNILEHESEIFHDVWNKLVAKYGRENMKFPKEITWLAGAPGSGKGTQSRFLASCRGLRADPIIMSKLLDSPQARKIKDCGGLVGSAEVLESLLTELMNPKYKKGVVVDGFPRSKDQVSFVLLLSQMIRELTHEPPSFRVLVLHINEDESVARQIARGNDVKSQNKILREQGLPLLEERETDSCEQHAHKRYHVFLSQYKHLLALQSHLPFTEIDASGPIQQVQNRIFRETSHGKNRDLGLLFEEIMANVAKMKRKPVMMC